MKQTATIAIGIICVVCVATMMGGCIGVETVSDGIQETLSTPMTGEYELQFPFIVTSYPENFTFADGGILEYNNIYGHSCTGTWVISDVLIDENNHRILFKIGLDDDEVQAPFGEILEWVPTKICIYGKPLSSDTGFEDWQLEQHADIIKCPDKTTRNDRHIHAMWRTI